jgi:hypothetical protein
MGRSVKPQPVASLEMLAPPLISASPSRRCRLPVVTYPAGGSSGNRVGFFVTVRCFEWVGLKRDELV